MPIYWLTDNPKLFPHHDYATKEGILAAGGDLSSERLLYAYAHGIFPWFNPDEPIIWWSPDPRFVLFPEELKVSKSMRPYFNQPKFEITYDQHFREVINACKKTKRPRQGGHTWITDDMVEAYCALHHQGYGHSVEVWKNGQLVGGLYGLALGKCFFGESMFSLASNASKFAFISLVRQLQALGFELIDCQQETRHLEQLGARAIPRSEFLDFLRTNANEATIVGNWSEIMK